MYIRRLSSKRYQCVIRLKGHKLSKTFTQRSDAKIWGREQEFLIDREDIKEHPKNLTIRKLIHDYRNEFLPLLKDQYNVDNQIKRLIKNYSWLIDKPYKNLKPIVLARW